METKFNKIQKKFNKKDIYLSDEQGFITCLDALKFLNILPNECADIIFLDPPFNLNKNYGKVKDNLPKEKYIDYINNILKRSVDVLKPGGALYLYHIPKWAVVFANTLNSILSFQHWIAISMKNGFIQGKHLYPAHYSLLLYTKGKPRIFKRPKIPILLCRHCNKPIKDYGGYYKFIKKGINLSDFWEDISPVRHKKYKLRSNNQLPIKVLDRITYISGFKNAFLIDPFAGTGTSAIVCLNKKIRYACNDIERKNVTIIIKRINKYKQLLEKKDGKCH